jgi:excisionase family DNA binding protein
MLLTAEQVSEILQVPERWVYQGARDGRIPHVKLGRYVRFEREQIEEWVASLRSGGRVYEPRKVVPRAAGRVSS